MDVLEKSPLYSRSSMERSSMGMRRLLLLQGRRFHLLNRAIRSLKGANADPRFIEPRLKYAFHTSFEKGLSRV